MNRPKAEQLEALRAQLAPENTRRNLICAGLFLAGWELLRAEVVENVKDTYLEKHKGKAPCTSPQYATEVLAKHRDSPLLASVAWLVENGAVTSQQAEQVRVLKAHRNEIAHELPSIIVTPGRGVSVEHLHVMLQVLDALRLFWGRMTVAADPRFDGVEVRDEEIESGSVILMKQVIAAATEAGMR